jgi:hypothetical protein
MGNLVCMQTDIWNIHGYETNQYKVCDGERAIGGITTGMTI